MPTQELLSGVFESVSQITEAEFAVKRTRLQILSALTQLHPDVRQFAVGQFPAFYRELPILHDTEVDPILPSIPMIVAHHPDISPREFSNLSILKKPYQRFLTCMRGENQFAYLNPRDGSETSVMFITNDGISIQISDMEALYTKQLQNRSVVTQQTLGIFYYPIHHPEFGTQLDARLFPIALPISDIIAFDPHGNLWTPQRLRKYQEALRAEEQLYAPVGIDTENTPRIIREWHRDPKNVFDAVVYALQSKFDYIEKLSIEVLPVREIFWGIQQQIKGFVHRTGAWNHEPVVSGLEFSIHDLSWSAFQSRQLQLAREKDDTVNIRVSLSVFGSTIVMKCAMKGCENRDEYIPPIESGIQDFWIRALSSMTILPAQKPKYSV